MTVTTKDATTSIVLIIGNKTAFVNGNAVRLDVPAMIESGRTLVPLRFISENLQKQVEWDNTSKTIFIKDTSSNTVSELTYTDNPSSANGDEDNLLLINDTTSSIDIANIHPAFVKYKDSKGFNEIYGKNKIGSRYKPMEEMKGQSATGTTNLSASELQNVTVELVIPSFKGQVDEVQATYTANYFYDETYILSYGSRTYMPYLTFKELVLNQQEFSSYSYDSSIYAETIYTPPHQRLDFSFLSPESALGKDEEIIINGRTFYSLDYFDKVFKTPIESGITVLQSNIDRLQAEISGFEVEIKEKQSYIEDAGKYADPNSISSSKDRISKLKEFINERQNKIDTSTKIIAEYQNYLSFLNGISSRQYNQFISQTEYK